MSNKHAIRSAALTVESRVAASSQQVSCSLTDEVVVLSLKNGTYYGLDPVAARIWELLQEARTIGAIRDVLLSEYEGAEVEECTRELLEFIGQLCQWELVDVVESRPHGNPERRG